MPQSLHLQAENCWFDAHADYLEIVLNQFESGQVRSRSLFLHLESPNLSSVRGAYICSPIARWTQGQCVFVRYSKADIDLKSHWDITCMCVCVCV